MTFNLITQILKSHSVKNFVQALYTHLVMFAVFMQGKFLRRAIQGGHFFTERQVKNSHQIQLWQSLSCYSQTYWIVPKHYAPVSNWTFSSLYWCSLLWILSDYLLDPSLSQNPEKSSIIQNFSLENAKIEGQLLASEIQKTWVLQQIPVFSLIRMQISNSLFSFFLDVCDDS